MFFIAGDKSDNDYEDEFESFGILDAFIDKNFIHEKLHRNAYASARNVDLETVVELQSNLAKLVRLRNLMFINMICAVLFPPNIFRHYRDGRYIHAVQLTNFLIIGCLLPLIKLRKQENPNIILYGNLTTGCAFITSIIINSFNGGFGEPTLFAILFPIVISLVCLDEKSSIFWGFSAFVQVAYFYIINKAGFEFKAKRLISPDTLSYHSATTAILLVVYLGIFYRLFVSLRFRNSQLQSLFRLLQKQKVEAENARKDIEQYISRMSHEYRSPLHGITSLTELAIDECKSEVALDYLNTSLSVCKTLKTLIGDVLTFFSSRHTPLSLKMSVVSVESIIKKVFDALEFKRSANVKFVDDVAKHISYIIGDETRMVQVLFNLVGNAVKFTSEGVISVSAFLNTIDKILHKIEADPSYVSYQFLSDNHQTETYICLEVKDTGVGIENDKMHRIFEPFVQADSTISRRFGGTGLGLSIVVDIVKAMKGVLWMQSEVDQGTTIGLAFKYTPVMVKRRNSRSKISKASELSMELFGDEELRVLVVDDSEYNLQVTERVLSKIGVPFIKTASSGSIALEMSKKETFNIYLIDLHMPKMDGLELVRALKDLERSGHYNDNIMRKYLAFTADVNPTVFERCHKSGFNGLLSKPARRVDFIEMFEKIAQIINQDEWIGSTQL